MWDILSYVGGIYEAFVLYFIWDFFPLLFYRMQAFVTPLFQTSRDVSSQIADLSTKDIVANIDRFAGSPEKTVAVLNELGERQEEIKSLLPSEKSAILKAGVSATIPMKEISSIADSTMNSGESGTDPNKVLESVLSSVPEMDTKALEVILESDFEGITTQDIVLSSVAVAMSAVKKRWRGYKSIG